MSDTVIRVDNLWKRYGLPFRSNLNMRMDNLRGKFDSDPEAYGPWSLKDVSFEVKQGESLGIVGKNGAGKSTLLKVLAGVSQPTRGSVKIVGRMFPMIELAAGMHNELTGRENIRLLGAVMGLSENQITAKTPAIEDFCELGEWLDKPVWQYSSGMQARLGFSVAVNVDAEILLIDEVLSVGDVNFQKKCVARMDDLISSGVTVLFVSHNPYAVERLCESALYLKNGYVDVIGSPRDVLTAYFQNSMGVDGREHDEDKQMLPSHLRAGTGDMRVSHFSFHDPHTSEEVYDVQSGRGLAVRIHLDVHRPVSEITMSLRIHDSAGTIVANIRPVPEVRPNLILQQNGYLECYINSFSLLPGVYWLEFVCKDRGGVMIDHVPFGASLNVTGDDIILEETGNRGFVYMPGKWSSSVRETVG